MMQLSTMLAIHTTIRDDGGSAVANQIVASWEHDAQTVAFFRASANFVFTFTQGEQTRFLRFAHADDRTFAAIEAELAYVHHLAAASMDVAKPIPSLAGNDVESVPTAYGVFHAVVFEALAGEQYDTDELSPEQWVQWGQALGSLHNAAHGYQSTGRATLHDQLEMINEHMPAHEHAARQALAAVKQQLRLLPINEHNFGLTHGDFELDNLVWNERGVNTLDFDDCAHCWFAADIAFALRDLFADHASEVDLGNDAFGAFVRGYHTARPLAEDEIQRVPLFLRMHNLIMFTKLLRTLDGGEQRNEPDWMVQLRHKLLAKLQNYREEFAKPHLTS